MSSCACSLLLARESPGTSPERCAVRLLDLGGLKGGLQTSAGPKCCGSDGGFAKAAQATHHGRLSLPVSVQLITLGAAPSNAHVRW